MLPLSVMAQSVTYNHDESVMNQFTIGETGAGSFTPDWYYDVLHKNYRNGAMMTNKQFFRSQMNLTLYQEVPHAESLDSALTERMRVEAKNIADRTPGLTDIAWQVERGKIESKLSVLKGNIERITLDAARRIATPLGWSVTMPSTVDFRLCAMPTCHKASARSSTWPSTRTSS